MARRFDSALAEVRKTTIFTTHTPVPAGHDAFPFNLVETHLAGAWGTLGGSRDAFLALGHYDNGSGPLFNMTALALRAASYVNGVSQLHGQVTREMWGPIWPGVASEDRPVRAITNGVHLPTWLSSDMRALFDAHLEPGWLERHDDPAVWAGVLRHSGRGAVAASAARCGCISSPSSASAPASAGRSSGSAPARVVAAGTLLDPHSLTIGFARRFTGYKRPELIFRDADRLAAILNSPRRPVQIVFAGKAHPADETGKHHLQQVYRYALDPKFGGRIAFVDDYDLHVAHFLVQGCDVWLNNPRKPLEASGTSGMKASINGVPNLSIGDGWWAEGYSGRERLAHRSAPRTRPTPTRSTPRTPRRSTTARDRRRPALLPARRARHPDRLARHRAPGDHDRRADVQRPAHGPRVRRDDVRAGARARQRPSRSQLTVGARAGSDGPASRTARSLPGVASDSCHRCPERR